MGVGHSCLLGTRLRIPVFWPCGQRLGQCPCPGLSEPFKETLGSTFCPLLGRLSWALDSSLLFHREGCICRGTIGPLEGRPLQQTTLSSWSLMNYPAWSKDLEASLPVPPTRNKTHKHVGDDKQSACVTWGALCLHWPPEDVSQHKGRTEGHGPSFVVLPFIRQVFTEHLWGAEWCPRYWRFHLGQLWPCPCGVL